MKKKRKIFRNSAVFLALITLTFYIILKDQNPIDILKIISSAKLEFVFIGICLYVSINDFFYQHLFY